ncbi:hypothetical protein I6N95_03815 [Vagococcus sp. BWB3-3]|uniref:Uncharacterized protein n=1 Tax=Vagococcus allomyrinae TaxID=2794353 RepID=A0A940P285_9ENTE|nr:hypothetical protein [Vagococcus allomyrinae]MBP1040132.1 hypothetical protein [Vagococcus allomyrinae]
MLTVQDITFTDDMILNGGKFILVKLVPTYQVDDNETEQRVGTTATVALTGHQLEKIDVLIDEQLSCASFNELELPEVYFIAFKGGFSFEEGEHVFHATADHLQVIT